MLSSADTEYKYRTETHRSGRIRRRTTTNTWIEDNVYANGVDLTTAGNILLNYHGVDKAADNKGVFAQGVNFNAGGEIYGLSDGNIYIQGVKDKLNSIFNSHTKKSFAGIRYGSSSSYINDSRERYRHSRLYGEAGIDVGADGKLKVEGVDVQSSGNVFLRGKLGTEVLHGIEESTRYEEHKKSGLTGSFGISWSGVSAGIGYGRSRSTLRDERKDVVHNLFNVGGNVVLESSEGNVDLGPMLGNIGGKLILTGKDINILDAISERRVESTNKNSYVGVGASIGIPVVSTAYGLYNSARELTRAGHGEEYIGAGLNTAVSGMGFASAWGDMFTNPLASNVSLSYSSSSNQYNSYQTMSAGSNIYVAGGVEYNGDNLHTRGLNIYNEGDTVYNITGKILKEAGKNTVQESSRGSSVGFSISRGSTNFNNPFADKNTTAGINVSKNESEGEGVYYTQNKDITKGTSSYNNVGDVLIRGVDVQEGKVEGNSKSLVVETLQDTYNSQSRGYNAGINIGFNNGKSYLSSVNAGISRGSVEQRISRNIAGYRADSGVLETGIVRQVGSLIDGNFTLNAKEYTKQDLQDIDRSRNIGVNITIYPNTLYNRRDEKGNRVYVQGQSPKEKGIAISTIFMYADKDKTREILSTIGEGVTVNFDTTNVNRDISKQVGDWEGSEVSPMTVNLGTEYWLTKAGRGKSKDILEEASTSVEGIRRILTTRDSNGKLQILKRVEAESLL